MLFMVPQKMQSQGRLKTRFLFKSRPYLEHNALQGLIRWVIRTVVTG